MNKLTLKQALYWSIRKWIFLSHRDWQSAFEAHNCLTAEIPELDKFVFGCALCTYSGHKLNWGEDISQFYCQQYCPLFKEWGYSCVYEAESINDYRSPYMQWLHDPKMAHSKLILRSLQKIRREL